MTTIKRNALVPFSTRQMFELVNAIEEYPRFLPWCHASEVKERNEAFVEASLDIAWSGIHKRFTTRNTLHPYDRVDLTLVEGPFRHLEGRWTFEALDDHACKVHLELAFELSGGLMDRMFLPVFNNIANSLVDLFCKRAAEVYGRD